jgi:uncharacterized protein YabE (DUF348 family)/3D (Asp-Asp-Asp) domain-containing protein
VPLTRLPGLSRALGATPFRRLPLFPVEPVTPAGRGWLWSSSEASRLGALAPVYVQATLAGAARGLVPLAVPGSARPLAENAPLRALVSLFAAFLLLWSTTLLPLLAPAALPLPPATIAGRASLAAELLRRVAAAFPQARSVLLARLHPGETPWWSIIEVDGRALRAAPSAASVQAALAAAGVRLDDGDRVLIVPNDGAALGAAPRPPLARTEVLAGAIELPLTLPLSAVASMVGPLPTPPEARRAPARLVVQRAIPITVVDGGFATGMKVAASTVGEALHAAGVDVDSADLVQPEVEAPLLPGMRITIWRARPVEVAGLDLQLATRTRAATVGELLAEQSVALGPLDRVEPPLDAPVPAGGTVRIVRVSEEERRETQLIPFHTIIQYDDRLIPGTRRLLRAGVAGLLERVIHVVLEDGAEASREVVAETVLRQPVDEIIAAGAAVMPVVALPGLPASSVQLPGSAPAGLNVRRVLSMEATAYDPGPASTGKRPGDPGYGITASGLRAGRGVVAVDPRVIPFYTRLYIPGYGYAVAGDTGSAIVGHRIDLGFNTYGEAIAWGRRMVTVYVLD